ncbi:MAG: signal peptidase I [Rhodospirillaceae bacterium]|nr:signal peptidase I [Rhodospirillaceae bacterium]
MRNGTKARRSAAASGFWETAKTLIYAVLIAVAVRTFLYEPFNIPSSSMVPTLLVGDYLFVSKYSYGYSKHSLPFSLPLFSGRIFGSDPQRGDVVVFKLPRDNKTDFIKRIVGLPGDRIQMIAGVLHINGEPVKRERIADFYSERGGNCHPCAQYVETLPNGVRHRIVEMSDAEIKDNTPEYVVPPGHYFAMGDNRDNSDDSRGIVGFIPAENLVGRAEILFYSTDGSAELWEFWKWPEATRWSRLFHWIR